MDVKKPMNCKQLRDCDVVDSSGEKVGRINDLTFTFDGTLKLSQFILAGSKWEEFLESAKISIHHSNDRRRSSLEHKCELSEDYSR
ncbi:MAG: PRC-barrel domain-containing protein [Candidatus Thorarchaeota archaeon]